MASSEFVWKTFFISPQTAQSFSPSRALRLTSRLGELSGLDPDCFARWQGEAGRRNTNERFSPDTATRWRQTHDEEVLVRFAALFHTSRGRGGAVESRQRQRSCNQLCLQYSMHNCSQ